MADARFRTAALKSGVFRQLTPLKNRLERARKRTIMDLNNNKFVEPVASVPDDEPIIHICPHCGANLFEVGVVEAISGGYSETEIHFENGEKKTGITVIEDFDEQWALCGKCNERIECTAAAIIEAFENQNKE